MSKDHWGQVQQELRNSIGQNNYKTWIEPLALKSIDDGIAEIIAPTSFLGNYVSQHFGDQILFQLGQVIPDLRHLKFGVGIESAKPVAKPQAVPGLQTEAKPEQSIHSMIRATVANTNTVANRSHK